MFFYYFPFWFVYMCTVYCTVYGLGLWDLSPVLAIQLVYFLPVSLRSLCVFLSGYKISK